MKYKKLLVLITCLLFVTVAVFCFASAFKVTDIDLNVTVVEGTGENIEKKCSDFLAEYESKNLIFVNKDRIESKLSSLSGYIEVVSVEKEFPNKISVTVKERVESLVLKNGDDYYAMDLNFNVLAKKQSVANNLGGNNLLIKLDYSDYSSDIKVGKSLQVYDESLLKMMRDSVPMLSAVQGSIESASYSLKSEGRDAKVITLKMKEGCSFKVLKADEETVLKLNATYDFYLALENKGVNEYVTVLGDDGKISIRQ